MVLRKVFKAVASMNSVFVFNKTQQNAVYLSMSLG